VLTGDLLDGGGRGVAQAIGGAALVTVVLLGVAVLVPVMIVVGLLHVVPLPSLGLPALPLPAVVAGGSLSIRGAPSAVQGVSQGGAGAETAPAVPPSVGAPVVDVAQRYLGVPYVFGGTNPAVGLDCSGLVQLVFHQLGISLPRTAQTQFDATLRLSRNELQPGDLVFFARTYDDPHDWITHVGIYIGDGLQINAPTEGQKVSIQPVFTGFWGAHFAGGGRVRHG
jgi:cell wall-associated NlpC family hydrolase